VASAHHSPDDHEINSQEPVPMLVPVLVLLVPLPMVAVSGRAAGSRGD